MHVCPWPVPTQAIAEGLADHKGLRDLSLAKNSFGDAGTQALELIKLGFVQCGCTACSVTSGQKNLPCGVLLSLGL